MYVYCAWFVLPGYGFGFGPTADPRGSSELVCVMQSKEANETKRKHAWAGMPHDRKDILTLWWVCHGTEAPYVSTSLETSLGAASQAT